MLQDNFLGGCIMQQALSSTGSLRVPARVLPRIPAAPPRVRQPNNIAMMSSFAGMGAAVIVVAFIIAISSSPPKGGLEQSSPWFEKIVTEEKIFQNNSFLSLSGDRTTASTRWEFSFARFIRSVQGLTVIGGLIVFALSAGQLAWIAKQRVH